ncbi:hypothetical protein NliqN6_2662 [Naganishia liquefaciens]|uniref:Major facilitator superfamily (MFS) profile domain-containing protein n=1 Tax=Naganishia liquefaciens TaxID=104408 RepID=A0A8H3YE78_9TREE|nr:hypothetical protein NliqN6_2662 [Naganishia liquefaciens]
MDDRDVDKLAARTTGLQSPSGKSIRRPSVAASPAPTLSYQNGRADSAREDWTAEALEIEEPPTVSTRKEYTDYPEGGFGWVVVFCAFILCFQFLGVFYAWGVVQDALYKQGLAKSRILSVIGGLSAFWIGPGCLLASWMLKRLSHRMTALIGVIGMAVSLFLSGFATKSVGGMIFLQGFVFGLSGAVVFLTAYTLPTQWFMKKRGLTAGITSCGGGVGGAVWAIAIEKMIEAWGLPWTYRFVGLMTLILCVPAAWTLRPGYTRPARATPTEVARDPETTAQAETPEKSIFRSTKYTRVLAAWLIASYPFLIPPYFISQYASSIGLSASQGALYSALFNIASAVGRLAFGFLADYAVGNLNAWILSMASIALSCICIWPYATSPGLIIFFVFICGVGSGGFFALQSAIVSQILGSHRVNAGISWLEVSGSFGYLAGPISAGALLDAFGGADQGAGPYRPAMYLVGGCTGVAIFLVISVRLSIDRHLWRKC